ncbi:MAG: SH3 domain-containing protein [Pseudomonadota bacterium]|nr:SH3 domain-containing protein [Pseudomonadota bacterium]
MNLRTSTARLSFQWLIIPLLGLAQAASAATPDYWQCWNRVGGEWNFGRVPSACDASAFINEAEAKNRYSPLVFNDLVSNRTAERQRYMQTTYTFLRDASRYYLLQRNPNATTQEQAAWQRAVFAMTHQETFWSHYRLATDQRLKMIRGDYGHGHGMFQVDDRYHYTALNQAKGADWAKHFLYAMDIYYAEWQRAASAWCVSSPTNWLARTRSAYSAYNGGSGNICRWTNSGSVWVANDTGLLDKYNAQAWLSHVSNTSAAAPRDVPCLLNGGVNCGGTSTPTSASGVVNTSGSNLTIRTGPGTNYAADGYAAHNTTVSLQCQTTGTWINGSVSNTNLWSRIANGKFLSNAFLNTNGVTPPACTFPTGIINTGGGVLNIRSAPNTTSSIVGTVSHGTTVTVYCQQIGTTVTGTYGTSNLWNRIADGQFVSDAYVNTGSDSRIAPICY